MTEDEKPKEETKQEETNTEDKAQSSVLETLEEIKKQNQESRELLKQNQELYTKMVMGGHSENKPVEKPVEETPQEYAKRVLAGQIKND